jgi:hypothetical protein
MSDSTLAKPKLTTSSMMASIAAEGQKKRPLPRSAMRWSRPPRLIHASSG